MKYVYAALLLHSAGKPISESSIKEVLSAAGIATEDARVKALVASLSEVNVDEVLKKASMMAVAAPAPAPVTAAAKPEEKAEEEEKKEEEALAGLGALFG